MESAITGVWRAPGTDAAEPITTELLRYGQRVAVVGPRAFGYEQEYRPLEPGGPLPWTTLA